MINPKQILRFFIISGLILLVLAWAFPKNGLQLGKLHLNFISLNEIFLPQVEEEELEPKTQKIVIIDSTQGKPVEKIVVVEKEAFKGLYIDSKAPEHPLQKFKDKLHFLQKNDTSLRILHFGDSQLEGDRLSSYLRAQWQTKYGGIGPGYQPATRWVPNMSVNHSQSEQWKRYAVFTSKSADFKHNYFGFYGSFSRYLSYPNDSVPAPSEAVTAHINFSPSKAGYGGTRSFTRLKIWMGNSAGPFLIEVKNGDELLKSKSYDSLAADHVFLLDMEATPTELSIQFTGNYSPDVYGISLEGKKGITLDNIAMRGATGHTFSRINKTQFAEQIKRENIGLVLLQFGGNAVPHLKDSAHAERVAKTSAQQVKYLKSLMPNASFVFIGPSDMATSQKGKIQTYPLLQELCAALKREVTASGAAYFDVMEAMGGKGAMKKWVEKEDPKLAVADYIHFTPQGAKKVAEWIYAAIDNELNKIKAPEMQSNADSTKIKKTVNSPEKSPKKVKQIPSDSAKTPSKIKALPADSNSKKKIPVI